MATDRHAQLLAATLRRTTATTARARAALLRLDQQGATINYATVSTAAGVSRSVLYRNPELRAEIERLRGASRTTAPRRPAAERMTQTSRDEILAALKDELGRLRQENQALRNRLAVALGEQRNQGTQQRP